MLVGSHHSVLLAPPTFAAVVHPVAVVAGTPQVARLPGLQATGKRRAVLVLHHLLQVQAGAPQQLPPLRAAGLLAVALQLRMQQSVAVAAGHQTRSVLVAAQVVALERLGVQAHHRQSASVAPVRAGVAVGQVRQRQAAQVVQVGYTEPVVGAVAHQLTDSHQVRVATVPTASSSSPHISNQPPKGTNYD